MKISRLLGAVYACVIAFLFPCLANAALLVADWGNHVIMEFDETTGVYMQEPLHQVVGRVHRTT